MVKRTRYPSFNVMDEREAWDTHTQAIVTNRVLKPQSCAVLDGEEQLLLRQICSALVDDEREEVIRYVLAHVDRTLKETTGEGERKDGIPERKTLILEGIQHVGQLMCQLTGKKATKWDVQKVTEVLQQISEGRAGFATWSSDLQREWFVKMLNLTVEAYCSYPVVWSEMGYAGPAYPRGYVRGDIGRLDPWEAKEEA
ncbi:gluconate 2-dehydrogenase subunit 3 family protein [Paenibacillus alvei]|uniref:gluconate 2-dehydrogenase subunit 3 family protein n=1 Tax=Paenibacillus alvei TaxID=44250 RepID=UPI003D29343E